MRKVPRILCERYELLDVLGKGAHGRIYLAVDLVTHERVAIKLVSIFTYLGDIFFTDGEIEQEQKQVLARDQLNEGHDEACEKKAIKGELYYLLRPRNGPIKR
jgi:serine/threonine protein kinase